MHVPPLQRLPALPILPIQLPDIVRVTKMLHCSIVLCCKLIVPVLVIFATVYNI